MRIFFIIAIISFCNILSFAEDRYFYSGPQVKLTANQYTCELLGKLQGAPNLSYQGMDCWGDYIISLQNNGVATTYNYNGTSLNKIGTFQLGSYSDKNHANVACFGNQFFAKDDKMPLLFVSQAYNETISGQKDILSVERIANNLKSSTLVAKIQFKDVNHLFGYALQWAVDCENNFLYGFGNTISNLDDNNKHRVVKFKIPQISAKGKKMQTIILTEKDMLENYLLEDYFTNYHHQIGQGLLIKHGYLYMPVGLGTSKHPSLLYVWDLSRRKMQNVIDLSLSTKGELEDCAEYMGELLIQTQGELYKLRFQ